MVTVEKLKKYIYMPNEAHSEDEMIQMCLDAADAYLANAIGPDFEAIYEENARFRAQADLFEIIYAAELFSNRLLLSGNNAQPSYMAQSLMIQLQLYTLGGK